MMDGTRRLAAQVLPIAAIFSWAVVMGAFAFRILISSQSTSESDVTTGQIAERVSRGEAFYVRPWEAALADISLSGGMVLFFVAGLTMQVMFGRESLSRFRAWHWITGLIAASVFWAVALTLHS